MISKWVLIFVGAGAGGVLRYAVSGWAQQLTGASSFPVGTLTVNLFGCLLIGFLSAALTATIEVREAYRIAVLVGLLGGFTTFSSFGYETLTLIQDQQFRLAATNILLSNFLGILAAFVGLRVAERIFGV